MNLIYFIVIREFLCLLTETAKLFENLSTAFWYNEHDDNSIMHLL